jgi:hypothetical protein
MRGGEAAEERSVAGAGNTAEEQEAGGVYIAIQKPGAGKLKPRECGGTHVLLQP